MVPAIFAIVRNVAGEIIGVHQTFLDPIEPRNSRSAGRQRREEGSRRGEGRHDPARHDRRRAGDRRGDRDDASMACARRRAGERLDRRGISLGNIAGGCTASVLHPTKRDASGKATAIRNGVPDMDKPGVVLRPTLRSVILLGDGDSEPVGTLAALATATRRYVAEGRTVAVAMTAWDQYGQRQQDRARRLGASSMTKPLAIDLFAGAMIARIPLPLARYIGATFRPQRCA